MAERNWIRTFALVILVAGTIGSMMIGNNHHDGWIIFVYAEIGVILTSAFFFALASILDQGKDSTNYLKEIIKNYPTKQTQSVDDYNTELENSHQEGKFKSTTDYLKKIASNNQPSQS